jgi:F0F1-type ATP synthase membrane subunit a
MRTERIALAGIVFFHLIVSFVHGAAHSGARVFLPFAGTLFVYIVILAGPFVGLALSRWRPRAGAGLIAATMTGALVFGVVNHFIIPGSDHVAHVARDWQTQFAVTAVLLAVLEAAGAVVGFRLALRRLGRTS